MNTDQQANSMGYVTHAEFIRISRELAEWEKRFTPTQPRTLRFFTPDCRPVATLVSTDFVYYGNHTDERFQTQYEYEIAIENKLHQNVTINYSFVEVFFGDFFVHRRYIRGGQLTNFISEVVDRNLDPLMKEAQVALKPVIDWKRVMSDSTWGREGRRDVTLRMFYEKYKIDK